MADGANPDAALLLAAGQLREGWVEREGLDETTPLSEGELAVATRMLAALRAAGTVTADEVGLLDSTLLTQYVRGEFDDDVAKWDAQLLKKVEAGLLLRGRGIYDVDSGATMYPPGFTYADLLKARVDLDERTHAAYVTRLFGESENGHLLHCERVMDVNIDALVAIPLEKVLLVRLQVGGVRAGSLPLLRRCAGRIGMIARARADRQRCSLTQCVAASLPFSPLRTLTRDFPPLLPHDAPIRCLKRSGR